MKKYNFVYIFTIFLGVLLFVMIVFAFYPVKKSYFSSGAAAKSKNSSNNSEIILEFGMFAGSNWGIANGDSYRIIDKAILKFEKSHPGVRVHYYSGIRKRDYEEWLSQQILQGKTPDVFMVPDNLFNKLASLGVLKELDTTITKDKRIKSWEYFPVAWGMGTYHGNQYALPYETDFMLMAANRTLIEKYGYTLPQNNWDWNSFYDLCKALTIDIDSDNNPDIAGVCSYTWKEAVYSNGIKLFNENGSTSYFSDGKVVEAVRFMQRLSDLTGNQLFSYKDFDDGKVAFMPMSFAKYKTYISYPYKLYKDLNYEWDCIPMPAGFSGNNISEVQTLLIGINEHTKQKKLAFDFLELLTHDIEIQTDVCLSTQGTSALRIVASTDDSKKILNVNFKHKNDPYDTGLIADILTKGIASSKFAGYNEVIEIADNSINKIISDKKDADNNLKSLQRIILTSLER